MNKDNKFYVTTAIDYVNSEPHIGHAYQKIIADVLARWNKVIGKNVRFVTGTDEHGKKVQKAAKKAEKNPKNFVNEVSEKFKKAWKSLNLDYDRFIRTTDKDHEDFVREFINKCDKSGDIYKGEYEGYYCVDCEAYYTKKDCPDLKCPVHKKPLEKMKEESYFFRLSKYQGFLLDLYEKNPEFVLPKSRRNEIKNRVKEGLRDFSITRTNFDWGIPFPLDKDHVVYVWFDALINYLSGSGKNQEFWPANLHLLGKDNTWFHCVYWPAMLKSAGYELPKSTFNHGFLSFDKQKISKSSGKTVSPVKLSEKYGADSVRYFCLRQFPFASGDDGDFSEEFLIERHNNELANKLGNLISRTAGLIQKKGLKKKENNLIVNLEIEDIKNKMDNYGFDKALNGIFSFIDKCNEYIQDNKPWELNEEEAGKILYEVADSIKKVSILLWPFIPGTCEKIAGQFEDIKIGKESLNYFEENFDENSKVEKKGVLFNKIDKQEFLKENKEKEKVNKTQKSGINMVEEGVAKVDFSEWQKLDLRVAEIKSVEDIEGADKLYKINLDVGELGKRTVAAGLKPHYSKEDLEGKKIVYFSNLEPKKLKGVESQGMVLAASTENHEKVILLAPEKDIESGAKIS